MILVIYHLQDHIPLVHQMQLVVLLQLDQLLLLLALKQIQLNLLRWHQQETHQNLVI